MELVLQVGRSRTYSEETEEIYNIMLTTGPNFLLRMVLFLRMGMLAWNRAFGIVWIAPYQTASFS